MTKLSLLVGSIVVLVVIGTSVYFYFYRISEPDIIVSIPAVTEKVTQSSDEISGVTQGATTTNGAEKSGPLVIREIHNEWAADFSNDRILVGGSHNVFVAKIIKQIDTPSGALRPQTYFEAEVAYNIKGSARGIIIVSQTGGYIDGVLYVVGGINYGDLLVPADHPEAGYMLQPGVTYLLPTRYSEKENRYHVNSFPRVTKLISVNPNLSNAQLRELAENDSRVKQLQAAYPQEILLSSDVARGDTRNSYQSLTEAQKYALPYYIGAYNPNPTSTASSTTQ
ncbi:MAG: hypothetical protein HY432_02175 [Candidatus Liptonbacteria bacterium]|nr:hypothetical protein [Candidatus Liptonbacteria bacterium]